MSKKGERLTLLYQENKRFIAGDIPYPVNKQEICENIAQRLRLPYPFPPTTRQKFFLGCLTSMSTLIFGGIGLFTLTAILSIFVLEFSYIIATIVATLMLLIALVIIRLYVNMLKASPTIIEDTYQSMVKQHNIVQGKVDSIDSTQSLMKVYYLIDNSNKLHSYLLHNASAALRLRLQSRLYILYLNDNIHILL